ncbi:MAG: UDP-N-acetylmuramate dehydrogenase [Patescibacteria group bacterium]|nr:UDP-N-acetylmuramate dehydrogenase [Patescibacteria group bacterium]
MQILENVSLAQYTTFNIGGPARFFCIVRDEGELMESVKLAQQKRCRMLVLGGGSNILISDAGFPGLVIKNEMKGVSIIREDDLSALVRVAAGEPWDGFVDWAVSRGLSGIENLSAIPGTAGAVPVQNIGAYGAEASGVIASVRVLDIHAMKFVDLSNADCRFSYRDSLFKHDKGRYVIVGTDFKLAKGGKPNLEYKDLKEYFKKKETLHPYTPTPPQPSLREVRDAVIDIRWRKLPDWKLWGTAGSYFKNPIISAELFKGLRTRYPKLPGYPEPDGRVKVSAAWLIDNICRSKGTWDGNVGSYEKQALVLVAKPGATAAEIVEFSNKLMKRIEHETGIKLEAEVEWVN